MRSPTLDPLPPTPGEPHRFVADRPVTIGAAADCTLRTDFPGVAPHHAVVEFREAGWSIRPLDGSIRLNGVQLSESTRLRDRDRLELASAVDFEFVSGEDRTRRLRSAADMLARPRKRSYRRIPGPRRITSLPAVATVVLAVMLVGGAAALLWYGMTRAARTTGALNDRQSAEFDSLLIVAYDHVERGGSLLELGLGDGAANEFARAVNTLALSGLRDNPRVKPRIEALEASVAAIYREQRMDVPRNYANATSPLTPDQLKTASLTVDRFAASFALMAAAFEARFGHPIIVSGRDHAEHVILYGKGGAMDLSIKSMSAAEIRFVIDQSHARHIRVKDFSQDTVLRRQVASAVRAGLLFEAGTGLHLHIDRFANRRDRWTTLAPGADRGGRSPDAGPVRLASRAPAVRPAGT